MNKRSEELRQLAINHVTHTDNSEFAQLVDAAIHNGKTAQRAIIDTYVHFPITSGSPSINALVELENFASSRYKGLNLTKVRQVATLAMNTHSGAVVEGYLAVIRLMDIEEIGDGSTFTGRP